MIYYAVRSLTTKGMTIHHERDEVMAIGKGPESMLDRHGTIIRCAVDLINGVVGTTHWWWDTTLSQAEFETYQVFGIKEIKL